MTFLPTELEKSLMSKSLIITLLYEPIEFK